MSAAAAAITAVLIALYVRRMTWRSNQERAITLNIALQGGAVVLMLPWTSHTLGQGLYELTGVANLEDLIAHDLYIVAASMIMMSGLDIQNDPHELQRKFRQRVELPCTAIIPIMTWLHITGEGGETQVGDFFTLTSGDHLTAYWAVLTLTLTYALGYSIWLFATVWDEPGFKWLMTAYIISASFGVITCIIKLVTAILPIPDAVGANYVWITASLCGTGFALASAYEWWRYMRSMSKRDTMMDLI